VRDLIRRKLTKLGLPAKAALTVGGVGPKFEIKYDIALA
jgi:hypothetical protein